MLEAIKPCTRVGKIHLAKLVGLANLVENEVGWESLFLELEKDWSGMATRAGDREGEEAETDLPALGIDRNGDVQDGLSRLNTHGQQLGDAA